MHHGSSTSLTLSIFMSLFVFAILKSSHAGNIATYWGQHGVDEGSLLETCKTGHYGIVSLAFLSHFGGDTRTRLNLDSHCRVGNCTYLSDEIKVCKLMGVKVLLSIGGPGDSYCLYSPDDARFIAIEIWNNFLGGDSISRPLGNENLDGVDFYIEKGTTKFWDVLAATLLEFSGSENKLYLSAAPQCPWPDQWLSPSLQTVYFDYVWVRFYNNDSCEYSINWENVRKSWRLWQANILGGTKMYLGLPASPLAAESGFVEPNDLISFLPSIKASTEYGGVMLWSRFYDHGYSSALKRYV